jgi:EAL domain-containing protein (putative c-di-GMP-specific phosphodiesterase class I)/DNA-binding response OmpR family regulator
MTAVMARQPAVLVADDDQAVRELLAFALRRAGFDVIEAANGERALEIARSGMVGLIVLDMAMPGMSGTEVVQAIRSRPETATMPVLLVTGSGDEDSVVEGLAAGADDFLPKPVRLDELVARVTAHLRKQAAWSSVIEDELRTRASVVAALAHLPISSVPEETAEAIVSELATRTESDRVAIFQLGPGDSLLELATYDRAEGVRPGGHTIVARLARPVLVHARQGPWVEEVGVSVSEEPASSRTRPRPSLAAGAPIYAGDDLVGILTIGVTRNDGQSALVRRARLLAAAIDYANIMSTTAGAAFADRRHEAAARAGLRQVLTANRFQSVFQPIVDLESRVIVGFEALTRFEDGTSPDVRFEEAEAAGLGPEFELATIRSAIEGAAALPADAFLSLNVSPGFVLREDRHFRRLVGESTRPLVLELTEHVPIDDYQRVRVALARIGAVGLAVDDAGAGYASLRHILELRPTYAKLDISLVRRIDGDDLRQALAAGLQYFAFKTGCRLIAEGVESDGEADVLRRLGVEYGQGYLFGKPAPVAA